MLTKISIDNGILAKSDVSIKDAIWIDVAKPSHEERALLNHECNIEIPEHHEIHQLEFSNRFYMEKNALYLSVNVITRADPIPESHVVTLILTATQLLTIRYSDPNPINSIIEQLCRNHYEVSNSLEILLLLVEELTGRVADIFELFEEKTEQLSIALMKSIHLKRKDQKEVNLNEVLSDITHLENLLSKCYQSMSSLQLLLSYISKSYTKLFNKELPEDVATLTLDLKVMVSQGEYLTQKLEFQLESTLGLINLQQTYIIKTFTVLAMIFMPPTLIASIYGMNFKHIPELNMPYGYGYALVLMFITSFVPYYIFKKKNWI